MSGEFFDEPIRIIVTHETDYMRKNVDNLDAVSNSNYIKEF